MNFTLDESQWKQVIEFQQEHSCTLDPDRLGAIGGQYTFCFTQTSIGMVVVIKCACGDYRNVTDYESW